MARSSTQSFPATLSLDLSKYPKLSPAQVGHLRHFYNLAYQPDGEWSKMGAQEPLQEFLDAYRYQLATMAYAVGVTHYHRLPALRSIFKPLLRQLIHKMLRREVWAYCKSLRKVGLVLPDTSRLPSCSMLSFGANREQGSPLPWAASSPIPVSRN